MNNSRQAMLIARSYIAEGIADYEYALCKFLARVCLANGDLAGAVFNTQTALFIMRIKRVM